MERHTGGAAVGVALAAGLAVAAALIVQQAPVPVPASELSTSRDIYGILEPGERCPLAKDIESLDDVASREVAVWAPTRSRLSEGWLCGDTPVLIYDGIQISYETGWGDVDVAAKWAALAKDNGGYVTDLLGRPAYVHEADDDGPRNGIMIVAGGELIRVTSRRDVPIDRLIALVEEIRIPNTVE